MSLVYSDEMVMAYRYSVHTDYTSLDGTVPTTELRSGDERRSSPLLAQPRSHFKHSLNADESRLALPLGQDIHVYNLSTGSMQKLRGHTSDVSDLNFSPTNPNVLISAARGHIDLGEVQFNGMPEQIILWDFKKALETVPIDANEQDKELATTERDKEVAEHLKKRTFALELSENKKKEVGDKIDKLWTTYETTWIVPENRKVLGRLADGFGSSPFSSNGRRIVCLPGSRPRTDGDDSYDIKVFDLGTKKTLNLSGHRDVITAVDFSPDGETIVSLSRDHTIRVWNADGTARHVWNTGHPSMTGVCSPDSKHFLGTDSSGKARVWSVESGEQKFEWDYGHWCRTVDWSSDGKWFATGGKYRARLVVFSVTDPSFATPPTLVHDRQLGNTYDPTALPDTKQHRNAMARGWPMNVIAVKFLGNRIASTSNVDQAVEVFDLESGRKWRVLPSPTSSRKDNGEDNDEDQGYFGGGSIGFYWLKQTDELLTVTPSAIQFWKLE